MHAKYNKYGNVYICRIEDPTILVDDLGSISSTILIMERLETGICDLLIEPKLSSMLCYE